MNKFSDQGGLVEKEIYTKESLCNWFNITTKHFYRNKERYEQDLNNYCDFHKTGDGLYHIDKVFADIGYVKKPRSKSYGLIHKEFDNMWDPSGYDTIKNVNNKLRIKYPEELGEISPSTSYVYTSLAKRDLYGKPFEEGGRHGRCWSVLCKKNEDDSITPFTEEEYEIAKKIRKEVFSGSIDAQLYVNELVENKTITSAEAWNYLKEISELDNNYITYLLKLQTLFNCQVVRGTYIEKDSILLLRDENNKE